MIEGFGIHSFRLINARASPRSSSSTGARSLACSPRSGTRPSSWPAPTRISTAATCSKPSRAGAFPNGSWPSSCSPKSRRTNFPFDHLDATKLIPEELVPLKVIGRMVLDRWPGNFFAETEQVAFCPSHIVPGIDFSNDPLLQGRLFSYLDTQLSRLGRRTSTRSRSTPRSAPLPITSGTPTCRPCSRRGASPTSPIHCPTSHPAKRGTSGFHSARTATTGEQGPDPGRGLCRPLQPGAIVLPEPDATRAGAYRLGARI